MDPTKKSSCLSLPPKTKTGRDGGHLICLVVGLYNYNKAIELNPKDAKAYVNRGIAHSCLGKYSKVVVDYSKAIELNPKHVNSYIGRAAAYFRLGKYNEAIIDYSKAIELNSKNAGAYYYRACAYSLIGNRKRALQDLSKVIKINPEAQNAAKTNPDFDNIKNSPDFKRLVGK